MVQKQSAERWATAASIAMGVIFIASGVSKIFLVPPVVTMFDAFHLPRWSLLVVGLIEVAAGATVLVRRARSYGALLIAGVMIGATLAHIMTHVYLEMIFVDVLFLALAFWLVKRERPSFMKPDWRHDPHGHSTRPH